MKEKREPIDFADDLTNEEVVKKILENGADEEMEKLRAFNNLTPEKLELLRSFARLRKSIHEESGQRLEERKQKNSVATAEELSMGAYKESIEPQVLNAVLNLRKKGYDTYISGFWGPDSQKIGFKENPLESFQLPAGLIKKFQARGVKIKIKPDAISFDCDSYLKIEELKEIWDEIEQAVPDLGKPAPECNISAAKTFREKQKEIQPIK